MDLKRVLVVDDSELLHKMYDLFLMRYRQYGCVVIHARHGAEAISIIRAQPDIELILLDVNMPVLGGLDTLRQLKAIGWLENGVVIMVSTRGREADMTAALELGAHGYVTKPIPPQELHTLIGKFFPTLPTSQLDSADESKVRVVGAGG